LCDLSSPCAFYGARRLFSFFTLSNPLPLVSSSFGGPWSIRFHSILLCASPFSSFHSFIGLLWVNGQLIPGRPFWRQKSFPPSPLPPLTWEPVGRDPPQTKVPPFFSLSFSLALIEDQIWGSDNSYSSGQRCFPSGLFFFFFLSTTCYSSTPSVSPFRPTRGVFFFRLLPLSPLPPARLPGCSEFHLLFFYSPRALCIFSPLLLRPKYSLFPNFNFAWFGSLLSPPPLPSGVFFYHVLLFIFFCRDDAPKPQLFFFPFPFTPTPCYRSFSLWFTAFKCLQ